MGFITNKERAKKIKKLHSGNGFRKFIIILTYIFSAICVAYVAFVSVINLIVKVEPPVTDEHIYQKIGELIVKYQWYSLSVAGVTLALILISIIMTLTLKSSKKVANEAVKLASIPVSGRKQETGAADFKKRITLVKKPKAKKK